MWDGTMWVDSVGVGTMWDDSMGWPGSTRW
jgi:hypothetical protein